MDWNIVKNTRTENYLLGLTIERALALLDSKGTDVQVSKAMTIVRIAFSQEALKARISPRSLHETACKMHRFDG